MPLFKVEHQNYNYRCKTFPSDIEKYLHFVRLKMPDNTIVFLKQWSASKLFNLSSLRGKEVPAILSKRPFCIHHDIDTSHHFCILALTDQYFQSRHSSINDELKLMGAASEAVRERFSHELSLAIETALWEGVEFPTEWTFDSVQKLKGSLKFFGYDYIVDVFY